jgi:hypothetical protein
MAVDFLEPFTPLLYIAAAVYLLGPVVTWLTFRMQAYSKFEVVEFIALPPHVQAYFAGAAPALVADGFVAACYLHNTGATTGVQMYLAEWLHDARGQTATCIAVMPAIGTTKRVLTFSTVAAPHGRTINTTNTTDGGIFELREWLDSARLPWVTDPRELYQVHLNRDRRLVPPDAVRFVPLPSDVPQVTAESIAHELREQVRAGLMRETSRIGEFRATWRGAWLMTMRLLPPLKQFRQWQARRRSRSDYEESKTDPAPPPHAAPITRESPFAPAATSRFPLNYA